jgi:hypothetical protein
LFIRYEDSFIKRDGTWRFAERKLLIDWTDSRPSNRKRHPHLLQGLGLSAAAGAALLTKGRQDLVAAQLHVQNRVRNQVRTTTAVLGL